MKFFRKSTVYSALFLILILCLLFFTKKTTEFAYIGLKTWFDNMIISLFPFMVVMNLLIYTGLSRLFIRPFYLLFKPIFRNSADALFVIFFGFLCGFPLGAKCAIDLYKKGILSKTNTEYLLCFTNNIGPAYMLGFFIGTICPDSSVYMALFCFYALPLFYGILLRYTVYKSKLDQEYHKSMHSAYGQTLDTVVLPIIPSLPDAIQNALISIASLGGYMIVFNTLRILPYIFVSDFPILHTLFQSILEISGGLLCLKQSISFKPLLFASLYAAFSFNGLCCHFQTFALMQGTILSRQKYMLHKIILCSITTLLCFFFYTILY